PEVGNAITPAQRDAIIGLLEEASSDQVRVVVLAAEGRHFCTGADLSAVSGGSGDGAPAPIGPGGVARMLRTGSQRLVAAVLDCEKPVVAEIHGAAAGIGAHLALAADFVVAAEGSRLIEVFARRGLVPDGGGAYLLPRAVGTHVAKRLLMLAEDLGADEARDLGLLHDVVPAEDLRATTQTLVDRLSAAPTRTLALTKWLVNRSFDSTREQAFADEAMAQDQNMATVDAQEGLAAFGERRDPEFVGW
ncbi:MAG: enoyl-CoA hydratase/isomerase family protein, partial [Aquihabitans sp.]